MKVISLHKTKEVRLIACIKKASIILIKFLLPIKNGEINILSCGCALVPSGNPHENTHVLGQILYSTKNDELREWCSSQVN